MAQDGDEQAAAVLAEFRKAFSHMDSDDELITAWLTERQKAALERYRQFFSVDAMRHDAAAAGQLLATDDELRMLRELRLRLEAEGLLVSDEDKSYVSDLRLLQYLRARDHVLDKSLQMLKHTLVWRRDHKPWAMHNEDSRKNKMSSDERILGFDVMGRVVVYSSFANTDTRAPNDVTLNTVTMMEKAALLTNARTPGSVIWVNHFGCFHPLGFGWRDCSPKFAYSGIDVFSNHYPECLQTMVIVDPPSIFFGLWKVIKPLLPDKTQQKGQFVHSDADNKASFERMFGPELAAYIIDLMHKDARTQPKAK